MLYLVQTRDHWFLHSLKRYLAKNQCRTRNYSLTICVCLKVISYSAKERLLTEVTAQHSNHRASLEVADMIENLINLKGISYRNFNRVRRSQRIELECLLDTFSLCSC